MTGNGIFITYTQTVNLSIGSDVYFSEINTYANSVYYIMVRNSTNNVLQTISLAATKNFNANPAYVYLTCWYVTVTPIALTAQTKRTAVSLPALSFIMAAMSVKACCKGCSSSVQYIISAYIVRDNIGFGFQKKNQKTFHSSRPRIHLTLQIIITLFT